MSKITLSKFAFNKMYPVKLAVSFFFIFILLTAWGSFVGSAKAQGGFPRFPQGRVELLTDDGGFNKNKVVHLDFSLVPCCRILSNEYENTAGVRFESDAAQGWATYQADKFTNHLSGSPLVPGAPTGITGTRIILSQDTRKVGMYIQAGSPFNYDSVRPRKKITVRAYDVKGDKIFEQATDTCLGKANSCRPKFIGVKSAIPRIRALEIVINEAYNWSIDDLKWEPWPIPTPSPLPTIAPTPEPTIYPSPIPLPTFSPLPTCCPSPIPTIIPGPTPGPTVYPSPIPLPTFSPLPAFIPSLFL